MNSEVHIEHLSESFGGGVLRAILEISRVQVSHGYKVTVIYLRREDTPSRSNLIAMFGDVPLIELDKSSLFGMNRMFKFAWNELGKSDRVIHAHSSWAGLVVRIAAVLRRRRTIFYTPHSYAFTRMDIGKFKKMIFYLVEYLISKSKTNFTLACSPHENRMAENLSKGKSKYLGNYCQSVFSRRDIYGDIECARGNKLFIGVGRLCNQKNPQRFVQIAHKFDGIEDFKWIGDGELKIVFENTKVINTGWVDREELFNYYLKSEFLILTSDWEGLPFTIIEAFSCGRPVIAFNIDGIEDYIAHGLNGYIVNDVEEAVSLLKNAIENPTLMKMLRKNSLDTFYLKYDLSILASKWQEIYAL